MNDSISTVSSNVSVSRESDVSVSRESDVSMSHPSDEWARYERMFAYSRECLRTYISDAIRAHKYINDCTDQQHALILTIGHGYHTAHICKMKVSRFPYVIQRMGDYITSCHLKVVEHSGDSNAVYCFALKCGDLVLSRFWPTLHGHTYVADSVGIHAPLALIAVHMHDICLVCESDVAPTRVSLRMQLGYLEKEMRNNLCERTFDIMMSKSNNAVHVPTNDAVHVSESSAPTANE
jgi:hypothetical protein